MHLRKTNVAQHIIDFISAEDSRSSAEQRYTYVYRYLATLASLNADGLKLMNNVPSNDAYYYCRNFYYQAYNEWFNLNNTESIAGILNDQLKKYSDKSSDFKKFAKTDRYIELNNACKQLLQKLSGGSNWIKPENPNDPEVLKARRDREEEQKRKAQEEQDAAEFNNPANIWFDNHKNKIPAFVQAFDNLKKAFNSTTRSIVKDSIPFSINTANKILTAYKDSIKTENGYFNNRVLPWFAGRTELYIVYKVRRNPYTKKEELVNMTARGVFANSQLDAQSFYQIQYPDTANWSVEIRVQKAINSNTGFTLTNILKTLGIQKSQWQK